MTGEGRLPPTPEAFASLLPDKAKAAFKIGTRNYTLPPFDGTRVNCAVWLDQKSFYLTNVTSLPPEAHTVAGLFNKSLNNCRKKGLQIRFGSTTAEMEVAWLAVEACAQHMVSVEFEEAVSEQVERAADHVSNRANKRWASGACEPSDDGGGDPGAAANEPAAAEVPASEEVPAELPAEHTDGCDVD